MKPVTPTLRCRRDRRRPQFRDQTQNVGEEVSGDGGLGHLERAIVTIPVAPILISFSFRLVSD
jgi:hypothetical protein